jgi:hypothetical protein
MRTWFPFRRRSTSTCVTAIEESPSDFVFPWPDGSMRSAECDPEKVLRRALAHAGLVERYEHPCRRCKSHATPHVEKHADATLRRCPTCNAKLWPKATPAADAIPRSAPHCRDAHAPRRRRCASRTTNSPARVGDDHDRHLRPPGARGSSPRRELHRTPKCGSAC